MQRHQDAAKIPRSWEIFEMQVQIFSVADLGLAMRAVRRSSRVRIDDLAATAGKSKQFVADVEHGKPTVQLGRVLEILAELGIRMVLDIPENAQTELSALKHKGLRPPRKSRIGSPK